ncbi:acyl-CoA synthetase [Streptomyces sp. NBC_01298]|uniref:acyl-CoA synthetase n=1 Tax=Streptomyces sp. NBC_01298 TaxID=2903817 RepID=UPI002E131302|nr:acyl-CoA synthetase [Streptomyces sp. NBC_01298]
MPAITPTPSFLASLDPSAPDADDSARALTIGDRTFTRGGLFEAAERLGRTLDGEEGPVAVNALPTAETVVAIVACLLSGVPVVPVPPDSGPAEIAHFLRDSGATRWLGPEPAGGLPPLRNPGSSASPLGTHRPAVIFYTSGTTGTPKGVLHSHATLAHGLDALAEAWEWTPDDSVVHGLPLFHLHGLVLGVLGALRVGSPVTHTGKAKPALYASTPGTMYFGVPTVWSRIAQDEEAARALSPARLVVSGSAPLPVPVFDRLKHLLGAPPIERYGMSETLITLSTRPRGERRPGWVGTALPGVETRLRAEDGGLLPADGDSVGVLEVRTPTLFDGYLGRPDATADAATPDGWFTTGDLAVRDAGGFHRIVGRSSTDLVKSGGYRIGTGEVEGVLLDHPAVSEAAVVGVADDDLGQRLVAYVVATDPPGPELARTLVAHAAATLSWHKRPREIRFLDSLPRNAMGKVQKRRLAQT